MSCGVGHRCSLDPVLLWLWHRPAATALIRPLAWEPPYAAPVALEKMKKKFFSLWSLMPNKARNGAWLIRLAEAFMWWQESEGKQLYRVPCQVNARLTPEH